MSIKYVDKTLENYSLLCVCVCVKMQDFVDHLALLVRLVHRVRQVHLASEVQMEIKDQLVLEEILDQPVRQEHRAELDPSDHQDQLATGALW